MNTGTLFVLVAVCFACSVYSQQRGIELRLTQKGLDYTIQEAIKVLRKDLNGKKFKNFNGRSSGVSFDVSNLLLRSGSIGSGSLKTSHRNGLTASVSGISANIYGRLHYEKRVWGFKISDTVNINARASSVSFTMSLTIGRRSDGRPSISVNSCRSNVGGLRVRFSGSKVSWVYNLFSSIVERKLKGMLSDLMCKTARASINSRGSAELAQFKVKKAIDKWAILDYSITAAPKFTDRYMDIFIKGEFIPRNNPTSHSSLSVPSFPTTSENNKMLYFWITDYTLNTAGEVYHKSGALKADVGQSSRVSPLVKHLLNTNKFKFLVPELARRFPNRPIQVQFESYKAPKISVEEGKIYMTIYAAAVFQIRQINGQLFNAFTVNIDIKADGTVSLSDKNIKGDLLDFSISLKTAKSNVGPVNIPFNQPFIRNLIKGAVMHKAKSALQKGFPLPNLKEVLLRNPEIKFIKGAIRVAADCVYISR